VCAFAGVVAGFWHILWIAGVGILVSGLVGLVVYSTGHVRLERFRASMSQEGGEPEGAES
jgi:hypothetical protein